MASWDEMNDLMWRTIGSDLPEATEAAVGRLAGVDLAPLEESDALRLLFATAFRDGTLAAHGLRMSFMPREAVLRGESGDRRINTFDVSLGMLSVAARASDFQGRFGLEDFAANLFEDCDCWPFPVPEAGATP
jgi:hypothetical protein